MLSAADYRSFKEQARLDAKEYRHWATAALDTKTKQRLLMSADIREDDADFYENRERQCNGH